MSCSRRYGAIGAEELYRRLAMGEPFVLLDVRTEPEFESRHIPGSILIPLHELDARIRELANGGTPIAVICEHGVRSAAACHLLAEHGLEPLYNLDGGILDWPGPVARGLDATYPHGFPVAPERFLIESFECLPRGLALDVAMGEGRNAIYLATRGFDVDGVDMDSEWISCARTFARRLGAPIRAVVGNMEDGTYIIPMETYDVVIVFNYLHRPLFTDIRDGLKPGGVVVYQSFTSDQPRFGPPADPARLLGPGELREVFADWEILRYREGIDPGGPGHPPRALAGIVAKKRGPG